MIFRFSEIINILLCVWFLSGALRKREKVLSFYLFVYGSLHFSYAALPMFTGASSAEINQIHVEGSGFWAALSTILALLTSLFLLGKKYAQYLLRDKVLFSLFLLVLVAIAIGYVINQATIDYSILKNVCAVFSMLVFMLLLTQSPCSVGWEFNRFTIFATIFLLVLMFSVASYELYSMKAWASFSDSKGEYIYRSSSLFFNPNLYGMWCGILAIGFAYLFHQGIAPLWIPLFGMTLSFCGIYLSGSRSAGFLVMVLLISVALFVRKKHILLRYVPIFVMLLIFCMIGFGAVWGSHVFPGQQANWHTIALLGYRFASYPWQLSSYALNKLALPSGVIPDDVSISIEGRFMGEMRDSGWLVLYDDTGWIGAIAVGILWCFFCLWGVKAYLRKPDLR